MILILSLLSFRKVLTWKGDYASMQSYFHFQPNGSFNITLNTDDKTASAQVYICSQYEYITSQGSLLCDIHESVQADKPFTGFISIAEAYSVWAVKPDSDAKSTLTVVFHNPNSYLDAQKQPCLFTIPIIAAIVGLIFIIWIINWALHFSCQLTLHTILTTTFTLTFVYYLLHFFSYWHLNQNDNVNAVVTAGDVFLFLHEIVFFFAMILTSKGWTIVHESFEWKQLLYSFFCTVMFIIPFDLLEFVDFGNYNYLFLVCVIMGMILYYRNLVQSIDDCQAYVTAHLIVIAEEGIDPQTTPIWNKYRIFRVINWGVMLFLCGKLLLAFCDQLFGITFWIKALLEDLMTLALFAVMAFNLRMKGKATKNRYMLIEDYTTEEPRQFQRSDAHSFTVDSDEMRRGTRAWEEGMPLPPQPIFVDQAVSDSHNNSEIQNDRQENNLEDL